MVKYLQEDELINSLSAEAAQKKNAFIPVFSGN